MGNLSNKWSSAMLSSCAVWLARLGSWNVRCAAPFNFIYSEFTEPYKLERQKQHINHLA